MKYEVKVLTGNATYAGTDAKVYIKIFGENGTAREVELNNGQDSFEKGQTDKFTVIIIARVVFSQITV